MERALTNFIRALRSSEVRVSSGEAIEAARAIALMGYADRETMKTTLACVLAKSESEKDIHDRLFDLYFSRQDLKKNEQAQRGEENQPTSADDQQQAPDLLQLATSGDENAIEMAIENAAEAAGLSDIRFSTQVSYYAQQMMKAMGATKCKSACSTHFVGAHPKMMHMRQKSWMRGKT